MFDDTLQQTDEGDSAAASPPSAMPSGQTDGPSDSLEDPALPEPQTLHPETYEEMARRIAAQHKGDPDLTLAMMSQEAAKDKSGKPVAKGTSWTGKHYGLMQVSDDVHNKFGIPGRDKYDPESNITAGVRYMNSLINQFGGDKKRALAAYNAGPGAVQKAGKDWWNKSAYWSNSPNRSNEGFVRGPGDRTNTQNYVKNIWSNYQKHQAFTTMNYAITDADIDKILGKTPAADAPSVNATASADVTDADVNKILGKAEPVASTSAPADYPTWLKAQGLPDDEQSKSQFASYSAPGPASPTQDVSDSDISKILGKTPPEATPPVSNTAAAKAVVGEPVLTPLDNQDQRNAVMGNLEPGESPTDYMIRQNEVKQADVQASLARKQKVAAVHAAVPKQTGQPDQYDFVKKGSLDIPATDNTPAVSLKYDPENQTDLRPGEYRVTDPDTQDAYIFNPTAGKMVDEADTTVVKKVPVPLGDPGLNIESVKTTQGEAVADALADVTKAPREDIADYYKQYGTKNLATGAQRTDPEYFKGFVNPVTGVADNAPTRDFSVTQRDLNNIEAFSAEKENQRAKQVEYNKAVASNIGEGDNVYDARLNAGVQTGRITSEQAADIKQHKADLRQAAKDALESENSGTYGSVIGKIDKYVPTEDDIDRKAAEMVTPEAIKKAQFVQDESSRLAEKMRGWGLPGRVAAGAQQFGGNIEMMIAGAARPFQWVPGIREDYEDMQARGKAHILAGDILNQDPSVTGWIAQGATRIGGDLYTLAVLSKVPGLRGSVPTVFAVQSALPVFGSGESLAKTEKAFLGGYTIGKVFGLAEKTGAQLYADYLMKGQRFATTAEARAFEALPASGQKKLAQIINSASDEAEKRSALAAALTGKTGEAAVITAGTAGVGYLEGHNKGEIISSIATNLMFHFAGQAAGVVKKGYDTAKEGVKNMTGRIVKIWEDGKPGYYFFDKSGGIQKGVTAPPPKAVEIETVADPDNPVYNKQAPVPETQTALDAQKEAAADPSQTKRIAVLYPKDTPAEQMEFDPKTQHKIVSKDGDTVIVDKEGWKAKAEELGLNQTKTGLVKFTKAGSDAEAVQSLVGRDPSTVVESTAAEPGRAAVEATNAEGKQVDATVVDTPQAQQDATASMSEQYPDAKVETKDSIEVIANRVADLKSEPGSVHKFSSTQVNLPETDSAEVIKLGKKLIPKKELYVDPEDPSYGREENPHITVKYGIHSPESTEVKGALAGETEPIKVRLGKVSVFPGGPDTPYDVVKVDVESPDLHRVNKLIADNTEHTDTFPDYKPHVTLAYVKKGEGAKYEGNTSLEGREITVDKLTFSGKNGAEEDIPLSRSSESLEPNVNRTTIDEGANDPHRGVIRNTNVELGLRVRPATGGTGEPLRDEAGNTLLEGSLEQHEVGDDGSLGNKKYVGDRVLGTDEAAIQTELRQRRQDYEADNGFEEGKKQAAVASNEPIEEGDLVNVQNSDGTTRSGTIDEVKPKSYVVSFADGTTAPYAKSLVSHITGEEGHIGIDLLTGGITTFAKDDVIPTVKGIVEALVTSRNDLSNMLFPANAGGVARQVGNMLRGLLGQGRREFDIANRALWSARQYLQKQPADVKNAFTDFLDGRSGPLMDPELTKMATEVRKLLDTQKDRVEAMDPDAVTRWTEQYFPRLWKPRADKDNIIAGLLSKRPLEGGKTFTKSRYFITNEAARNSGLEPVSDNPIDIVLLHTKEMERFIAANTLFSNLKDVGLSRFARSRRLAPEGWVKVPDRLFDVTYKNDDGELVKAGNWYMPKEAARLINNYLSPGLGTEGQPGAKAFRAWMYSANLLNQFQLGLSGFHLGFTSIDVAISKVSLAVYQASKGYFGDAVNNVADIFNKGLVAGNFEKGNRLYNEWQNPMSTDLEYQRIAQMLADAGGSAKMDDFYHTGAARKMVDAARAGNIIGAAIRVPAGVVDAAAYPIMSYVVPRQKLGVFFDMAKFELKRLKGADQATIQNAMVKAWDSVDNRMGQMVYDNLFWNNMLKDTAMATTRSVGWNLGTIREIGGGVKDAMPWNVVDRYFAGDKSDPVFTHRMGYVTALAPVVATIGAVTQYLFTGKAPNNGKLESQEDVGEALRDMFYPQTGNLDDHGRPERLNIPSYAKDIVGYYKKTGETIAHKLHPLASGVLQWWNNKDFYGNQITNPKDDPDQKTIDTLKFIGESIIPFGIKNTLKQVERKGTLGVMVAGEFGFTIAPNYINATDAEEKLGEMLQATIPDKPKDKADQIKMQTKVDLVRTRQRGNDAYPDFQKAVKAGVLQPSDWQGIVDKAKPDYMAREAKRLSIEQVQDLIKVATTKEKEQLEPVLREKEASEAAKSVSGQKKMSEIEAENAKENGDPSLFNKLPAADKKRLTTKEELLDVDDRLPQYRGKSNAEKVELFKRSPIEDQAEFVTFLNKAKETLDKKTIPAKNGKPKAPLTQEEVQLRTSIAEALAQYRTARAALPVDKQNELVKKEMAVKASLPQPAAKLPRRY